MNRIADPPRECDTGAMSQGAIATRLGRRIGIAAAAVAALFGLAAAPGQSQSHARPQQQQRIVAVGDLHGDYAAWLDIARDAKLIDGRGHWTGGKTTLVQLGDVLDRGPDSLKIVRNLQQLQQQAQRAGGRVVVLVGNHEAMNVIGDYRYTTPGEYAAFADAASGPRRDRVYELNRTKIQAAARAANPRLTPQQIRDNWIAQHPLGWVEHRSAWSPSGELGQWASRNPAVAKIDGTLFVHGGLSSEYTALSLDQINRRTALAMQTGVGGANSILDDPLGPLWYRGLVAKDRDASEIRAATRPPTPLLTPDRELEIVLGAYGAKRIVLGHTPSLSGIQITNGGRLARIDTGISRYYNGPLSWLEIVGGAMIPHTARRSTP